MSACGIIRGLHKTCSDLYKKRISVDLTSQMGAIE